MKKVFLSTALFIGLGCLSIFGIQEDKSNALNPIDVVNNNVRQEAVNVKSGAETELVESTDLTISLKSLAQSVYGKDSSGADLFAYNFTFSIENESSYPYAIGDYKDYETVDQRPYLIITTSVGTYSGLVQKRTNNNTKDIVDIGDSLLLNASVVGQGDFVSAKVENIIKAEWNGETFVYDLDYTTKYFTDCSKPASFKLYKSQEYLNASSSTIATFGSDTYLTMTVASKMHEKFFDIKKISAKNKALFDEGKAKILVRLTTNFTTNVEVVYKDGSAEALKPTISTDVDGEVATVVKELSDGNHEYSFIIRNVTKEIVDFRFNNFTLTTFLYLSSLEGTPKAISGTTSNITISSLGSNLNLQTPNYVNYTLINVMLVLGITLLCAGISVPSYFVLKEKYKDDEFKRIDTKDYVKTSILTWIAVTLNVSEVFYCIIRAMSLNNLLPVSNIIDVLIIIFGIAGFLMICYFVRRAYIAIKNIRAKKREDALKSTKKEYYF